MTSKSHREQLQDMAADKTNPTKAAGAKQMLDNMAAHEAAGTKTYTPKGK